MQLLHSMTFVLDALFSIWTSIRPAVEWTIDAAGDLGPFAVAWMVYKFGTRQHAEVQQLADRQLVVDEQNFRMVVLDRRKAIINAFEEVVRQSRQTGSIHRDALEELEDKVDDARYVFGTELFTEAYRAYEMLIELFRMNSIKEGVTDAEKARFRKAQKRAENLRTNLGPLLGLLLPNMILMSRVDGPGMQGFLSSDDLEETYLREVGIETAKG